MASCSSPNDAIRLETAFIRHIAFYGIFLSPGFCLGIPVDLLTKVVEMTADYMRPKDKRI